MNPKSDVDAKIAFKHELERRGYTNVRITAAPADITASLGEKIFLFELKVTSKLSNYFGAATITEWEAALREPERFRFVIARKLLDGWTFKEYSPEEFFQFSDIPPFKVYFRVPFETQETKIKHQKNRRAVAATLENLRQLIAFRTELKRLHDSSQRENEVIP